MMKYLFIGAILGIILVSGCVQNQAGLAPCNWVFKTNDDYSNLISVGLTQDRIKIAGYPIFNEIKKLEQNYFTAVYRCAYSDSMKIAFTSVTQDEWNSANEDCAQQIEEKDNQIKIDKCGSLDFDIFEECNTFTANGERICKSTTPPLGIENPTKCAYDITLEENVARNSCEFIYSSDVLLENIIDDNPFTELYLCKVPFHELNSIINNNELDSKCDKKI